MRRPSPPSPAPAPCRPRAPASHAQAGGGHPLGRCSCWAPMSHGGPCGAAGRQAPAGSFRSGCLRCSTRPPLPDASQPASRAWQPCARLPGPVKGLKVQKAPAFLGLLRQRALCVWGLGPEQNFIDGDAHGCRPVVGKCTSRYELARISSVWWLSAVRQDETNQLQVCGAGREAAELFAHPPLARPHRPSCWVAPAGWAAAQSRSGLRGAEQVGCAAQGVSLHARRPSCCVLGG